MTNTQTTQPTIKSIEVSVHRWFQRTYGNTYHSIMITVIDENYNALKQIIIPFKYGYENHYKQTALEAISELNLNLDNINIEYSVKDVKRKKDLHK